MFGERKLKTFTVDLDGLAGFFSREMSTAVGAGRVRGGISIGFQESPATVGFSMLSGALSK